MKDWFKYIYIIPLFFLGFLSFLPFVTLPAHADIAESCEDFYNNKFYCHCDGNRIVCPDEHQSWGIAQCLTDDDGYILKEDCGPTKTCKDSGAPVNDGGLTGIIGIGKDKTAKDARCVDNPIAAPSASSSAGLPSTASPSASSCTCDHLNDPGPNMNGRTCMVGGQKVTNSCATWQLCTGKGECKAKKCSCDGDKIKCDGDTESRACSPGTVCSGEEGTAICVDKAEQTFGKCTCDPNNPLKVVCPDAKDQPEECDEKSPCVVDANEPIGVRCGDQNPVTELDPTLPPPPPPPCSKLNTTTGSCETIETALGAFDTNPEKFISLLFGFLLSVSGGIALLLIIKAGYKIMTSQGKPEAVQQGRDELIASVVGLLFLIFSFVILEVIGVDILRIQDFGGSESAGGTDNGTAENGSCDVNKSNECASGLTCQYTGSGGQCKKASTGNSCDPNGSNQCPAGQVCRYNGSTGQCQALGTEGAGCEVGVAGQCASGLTCKYNGSGGTCQK